MHVAVGLPRAERGAVWVIASSMPVRPTRAGRLAWAPGDASREGPGAMCSHRGA